MIFTELNGTTRTFRALLEQDNDKCFYRATLLPDHARVLTRLRATLKTTLYVRVLAAENLANADEHTANIEDVSDPYVEVVPLLDGEVPASTRSKTTRTEWDTLNPVWDEQFEYPLADDFKQAPFGLEFVVRDDDEEQQGSTDAGSMSEGGGTGLAADLAQIKMRPLLVDLGQEELQHDNLGKLSIAPAKLVELAHRPFGTRQAGKQLCGWFPLDVAPGMSEAQGSLHVQVFIAPEGHDTSTVLCLCSSCEGARQDPGGSSSYFDSTADDESGGDEEADEEEGSGRDGSGRDAEKAAFADRLANPTAGKGARQHHRMRLMVEQALAGDKALAEKVSAKLERMEGHLLSQRNIERWVRVGGGQFMGRSGVFDPSHIVPRLGADGADGGGRGTVEVRLDGEPDKAQTILAQHLEKPQLRCVLYENQRWMPKGWSSHLLPTDRGQWSDRTGRQSASFRFDKQVITSDNLNADRGASSSGREEEMSAFVRTLFHWLKAPANFKWKGRWHSDTQFTKCDDEGWSYGFDFKQNHPLYGENSPAFNSCVRQRRWVRYLTPPNAAAGGAAGDRVGGGEDSGGGMAGDAGTGPAKRLSDVEVQQLFKNAKEEAVVMGSDCVAMQGSLYWQRQMMRVGMVAGPFAKQKGLLREPVQEVASLPTHPLSCMYMYTTRLLTLYHPVY
jgi:hypothetical protein